jgi:hypothetical protein
MNSKRILPAATIAAMLGLALVVWLAPTGNAQSTTGSIYGTVADSSGAVIPQAAVTVVEVQTNETHATASNESGNYVFPSLAPGSYTVTAKRNGYQTETQTGIRLDTNQNLHVIFNLNVGSIVQNVTVTATTTLVDTRESELGSTIDQARLEQLPLNGRNAYDLVQLSPGVTNYSAAQNSQYVGDVAGATFSTNGLRAYENSFYLDGANNTSYYRPGGNYAPNPDALLEFRILTSNFDAEFGSMPGAVVNMVTRSGTNSFHGLAYDFVRNTIFNAKTWPQSIPGHLRYNQFGGNLGGPILHNRLFGFFSYQGLRIAQNAIINAGAATVPTAAERAGDFTADGAKSLPKCTGTSSANTKTYPCGGTPGLIPQQYLDPVVQNILKSIPLPAANNPASASSPDGTPGGPTAQQTANQPVGSNQYLGRGDYELNDRHRLSFMYFHEFGTQQSPTSGGQTVLGYAGDLIEDAQENDVGTDTWTISPNILNTVRAYYTGNHYQAADIFAGKNTFSQLGMAIPCGGSPCTQPNVRIPGYIASLGNSGSAPNIFTLTTLGAGDTLIWTHGNHSLKFGATIARNKFATSGVGQRAGIYTINGNFSGNPLADFLMGKAATYNQNNSYPVNLHQWDPAVFAQDDWKIARRLTVNLGVRWEVFEPFYGENNTGTFVPNVQSTTIPTAPLGILFNGDKGVPDGILQTTWDKFAPRLGFAFDVFGDGSTSVRGAAGLFYSQVAADFYSSLLSPIYNEGVQIASTTSFANPYAGSTVPVDPFPYTPNLKNPTFAAGLAFPAEPPNNKAVPYVTEYNLTIERQFGSNWSAGISYVGNTGRKFYSTRDENAPLYSPTGTATGASELARRPYKPAGVSYVFNAIDEYYPGISSSYNSLQATLTKRFAHSFSINANYVWSKDMADGIDPTANPITTFSASNEYSFKTDYGKASYDLPQRFVASYLWVSPAVHAWGFVGREALSGWRLSGITTLSTGTPFNMVSGTDTNLDGYGNDRPNQIADWHLAGGRSRTQKAAEFFNVAGFSAVPAGTATGLGNTQFNLMIGPGRVNTDMAAAKDLAIKNENQIQFRADAFNLFSNVNLGNPTAQLSSPSDGKITGAAPGRILQLSLKYSF